MKRCCTCQAERPLTEFGSCKSNRDGLQKYCKPCGREKYAAWRARNTDKAREQGKARQQRYAQRHPERVLSSVKTWQAQNPDRCAQINAEWRKANPEKARTGQNRRSQTYRTTNPDKIAARAAERRAAELRASLPLDAAHAWELRAVYAERETGIEHHVDHIVPLRGKTVWGLHVPWNLEVIPAHLNIAKSNKVDYSRAMPTCMDRN